MDGRKITPVDDREFNIEEFSPTCFWCKHLINDDKKKRKCWAFEKIPLEIWNGDNDHTKAYPGDRGVRFKEREGRI